MAGISLRFKSIMTMSILPGMFLGAAGDIFTPVGGAMLIAVIGILAIVLAIKVLLEKNNDGIMHKIIGLDKGLNWWLEGKTSYQKHAVWVLAIFGIICLFSSSKSFSNRNTGGFLANDSKTISSLQESLLGRIADDTNTIAKNTSDIAANTALTKKETSDNPRKELANAGVSWSDENFCRVIESADVKTVRLFIAGGMQAFNYEVTCLTRLLKKTNGNTAAEVIALLEQIPLRDSGDEWSGSKGYPSVGGRCTFITRFIGVTNNTKAELNAFSLTCSREGVKSLKVELASLEESLNSTDCVGDPTGSAEIIDIDETLNQTNQICEKSSDQKNEINEKIKNLRELIDLLE